MERKLREMERSMRERELKGAAAAAGLSDSDAALNEVLFSFDAEELDAKKDAPVANKSRINGVRREEMYNQK